MNTGRIAPNLSYLTIYNPTLHPSIPNPDDEDAQEQAQILFYTSKERAVSRDRMLRQVGLAKALVNFSEMFNPDEGCDNVHSQTRRMVMVFPEPDFCIHAGVELAKVPRNSKGKDKAGVKSILKGKDKEPARILYDYIDASVNDQALQADILRGYEQFKLKHGSFTSILSTLGQQALELQLERFFTVWAWSWNIEDGLEFGQHLGTPLHPLHRRIIPLLDTLFNDIPDTIIPIALTSTHAIPSTRFSNARLPAVLSQHLLTLVPPPPESVPPSPSTPSSTRDGTIRPKRPPDTTSNSENEKVSSDDSPRSSFMGMNVDVTRWSWLNFGKNGKKSANQESSDEKGNSAAEEAQSIEVADATVDQNALDDAMSSEGVTPNDPSSSEPQVKPEPEKTFFTTDELDNTSIVSGISIEEAAISVDGTIPNNLSSSSSEVNLEPEKANIDDSLDSTSVVDTAAPSSSKIPSPSPARDFMVTSVHLASEANPLNTSRTKVCYLTKRPFMIALVGVDDESKSAELEHLSRKVDDALDAIGEAVLLDDEAMKSSTETIPSLTKILQPKDRHVFTLERAPFTIHENDDKFTSNSLHLFNAMALLKSPHGIQEVFSRGQSPQHWHMGRNIGCGIEEDQGELRGEMYMEVFRKETTLTDVDNVLTGTIRRMEDFEERM